MFIVTSHGILFALYIMVHVESSGSIKEIYKIELDLLLCSLVFSLQKRCKTTVVPYNLLICTFNIDCEQIVKEDEEPTEFLALLRML